MNFGLAAPERVFVVWFGPAMSETRLNSLAEMQECLEVEVILITAENLPDWVVPAHPLHPAFQHLSAIHKSDYLRCYLLHLHGGGYADIKRNPASWRPAFARVNRRPCVFGVGYPEVGRHGVAQMGLKLTRPLEVHLFDRNWWLFRLMQAGYRRLIGNCAFIFRPQSDFTQRWFDCLHNKMDGYAVALAASPGRHPKERPGLSYDGILSRYPVPWSDLLGNLLHPLVFRYSRWIDQSLPTPDFSRYE